jgi:hypothetical protein
MKNKIEEKNIWQSKVFPELVMTQKMLDLLHYRYSFVKNWHSLMLDLETYLVRKPDKTPKDFKKFVLNCAKRRVDDIQKGKRYPDGSINLKKFQGPEVTVRRDESFSMRSNATDTCSLRIRLQRLERGTPEYNDVLAQLKKNKENKSQPLLLGDIFKKISSMTEGGAK